MVTGIQLKRLLIFYATLHDVSIERIVSLPKHTPELTRTIILVKMMHARSL